MVPAAAQSPLLSLEGKVKTSRHFTLDDLKKMPAEHADAVYQGDHGPTTARYTGILLWALIEAAGGIDDATRGAAARHAIRVTATDGYAVVISTGEIAPEIGGKQALVAYERDGAPLADFRVVVPGDKSGDRNVHDVATIAVE
jgi:DMSO/TMAO reductase YedYZ molybdopterin-dependent catalytic subunit